MYVGLIPVSWARVGRGGCESVGEKGVRSSGMGESTYGYCLSESAEKGVRWDRQGESAGAWTGGKGSKASVCSEAARRSRN